MHDAVSLCRPSPPPAHDRPCTCTLPASTSRLPVADWLAGIKMERYAEQLARAGYRSAADAARLQRHDLVALGITLAGHQKKILGSAAVMKSPSSVQSRHSVASASAAGGASFVWWTESIGYIALQFVLPCRCYHVMLITSRRYWSFCSYSWNWTVEYVNKVNTRFAVALYLKRNL